MEEVEKILTKEETQRRLQHKRHLLYRTELVLKMPEVTGKEYLHYFMERRLLKKDIEILEERLNHEKSRKDSCS